MTLSTPSLVAFNNAAPLYQDALRKAGYNHQLVYKKIDLNQFNKKKRSRPRHSRIFWFNPPYDERVRTNVIQRMFAALEKCYPRGHRLHKIFNRHTIKASYRTLANMQVNVQIHNSIIIKEYNQKLVTQQPAQPRVPPGPGPHHQQPAPPPGPPVTRSMSARAASLTPPTLSTPAPALARASSTPLSAAPDNINTSPATTQSSQPLMVYV